MSRALPFHLAALPSFLLPPPQGESAFPPPRGPWGPRQGHPEPHRRHCKQDLGQVLISPRAPHRRMAGQSLGHVWDTWDVLNMQGRRPAEPVLSPVNQPPWEGAATSTCCLQICAVNCLEPPAAVQSDGRREKHIQQGQATSPRPTGSTGEQRQTHAPSMHSRLPTAAHGTVVAANGLLREVSPQRSRPSGGGHAHPSGRSQLSP